MNLHTTYLGMPLKNPLVPSSSPLSKDIDSAKKLEDAGAAALELNVYHIPASIEERRTEGDLMTITRFRKPGIYHLHSNLPQLLFVKEGRN